MQDIVAIHDSRYAKPVGPSGLLTLRHLMRVRDPIAKALGPRLRVEGRSAGNGSRSRARGASRPTDGVKVTLVATRGHWSSSSTMNMYNHYERRRQPIAEGSPLRDQTRGVAQPIRGAPGRRHAAAPGHAFFPLGRAASAFAPRACHAGSNRCTTFAEDRRCAPHRRFGHCSSVTRLRLTPDHHPFARRLAYAIADHFGMLPK